LFTIDEITCKELRNTYARKADTIGTYDVLGMPNTDYIFHDMCLYKKTSLFGVLDTLIRVPEDDKGVYYHIGSTTPAYVGIVTYKSPSENVYELYYRTEYSVNEQYIYACASVNQVRTIIIPELNDPPSVTYRNYGTRSMIDRDFTTALVISNPKQRTIELILDIESHSIDWDIIFVNGYTDIHHADGTMLNYSLIKTMEYYYNDSFMGIIELDKTIGLQEITLSDFLKKDYVNIPTRYPQNLKFKILDVYQGKEDKIAINEIILIYSVQQ
jgi:hypothetical protein